MSETNRDQQPTMRTSDAQARAEQGETERLRAENEQLKAENVKREEELRSEHDSYLRTLADFENYRRRIERERSGAAQAGKREIVLSLLEVMDDFERALEYGDQPSASIAEGLRAVHRRLARLLQAQGVTPFESVGRLFDPTLHEAVGSTRSDDHEPGTVLEELSQGYRWGEELLRPARVRVVENS